MVGLYIFGVLVIIGIVALFVFRAKSGRTDRTVARGREERISVEKIKDADRAEARGREEKTKEQKNEK